MAADLYPAFTRPNVELVDAPIERVSRTGSSRPTGERPVDTLIYATGFRSTEFLAPMDVVGREGRKLTEVWSDGAHAFLGMMVPGFPNLFLMYGPNTNLGHNSVVLMLERQAEHIVRCVRTLRRHRLAWMDVREEVAAAYDRMIRRALARTVWEGTCTSWYKTASGRVTNNWPLTPILGALIELRLFRAGWSAGWEAVAEGSALPPGDGDFQVGEAAVDEDGVVAA